MTDERGRHEIETIIPSAYPIPPGMPGLEKMMVSLAPDASICSSCPFCMCLSRLTSISRTIPIDPAIGEPAISRNVLLIPGAMVSM